MSALAKCSFFDPLFFGCFPWAFAARLRVSSYLASLDPTRRRSYGQVPTNIKKRLHLYPPHARKLSSALMRPAK
jgi:hypothetical protein